MSTDDPTLAAHSAHPYLGKRRTDIRELFDGIAPRYDLLNHLLSFNLDHRWRKQATACLELGDDRLYLDACAGTGDLAFALQDRLRPFHNSRVVATDFSLNMLKHGVAKTGDAASLRFLAADTLSLPFADSTFHGAMVGFGIRNVENLEGGLAELARVLRGGARLVLLEFTRLDTPLVKHAVNFYSQRLLPWIGNTISGTSRDAYGYLQQSIERWPPGDALAELMTSVGFKGVRWRRLFPGNVALHIGHGCRS